MHVMTWCENITELFMEFRPRQHIKMLVHLKDWQPCLWHQVVHLISIASQRATGTGYHVSTLILVSLLWRGFRSTLLAIVALSFHVFALAGESIAVGVLIVLGYTFGYVLGYTLGYTFSVSRTGEDSNDGCDLTKTQFGDYVLASRRSCVKQMESCYSNHKNKFLVETFPRLPYALMTFVQQEPRSR